MNPIFIAAAGGAALLLFLSKKSDAKATTPTTNTTPEGSPPGGWQPNVQAPGLTTRPTSELSDAQRERMAEALGRLGVSPATGKLSGAADASAIQFATTVIGELEAAGFKDAAAILRGYTDEAAKAVQTPAEAAPIAQAAATVMTKEQAEYVSRLLALERDPNKIGLLIDWLKKLPPSTQRDTFIQMAQALRLQLEAANVTTDTLDKIDQVIQATPDEEDEEPQPGQPPVYTSTSPGQPTGTPPVTQPATPLPERPAAVPAAPQPQPLPAPLTDAEIVARQLTTHLATLQSKHGVKGAKGKEDKLLVKKFQKLVGLKDDGSAGPGTFILLAGKGGVSLPLVYYWPTGATAAKVAEYRASLEKIAQALEKNGRRDEANTLRVSIAREHGEGGIVGPLYGAPAAANRPAAVPVPTSSTPGVVRLPEVDIVATPTGTPAVDPYPNSRLLEFTKPNMSGEDVKRWQAALNRGGFNVGTVDGFFGPSADKQTRAFQRANGLDADGRVGPMTRMTARKRGMW